MAQAKKKSRKTLYIIIGAVVGVILFLSVAKSAGWIGKPTETEVEIALATRNTITEKVSASGMVQPVTEVKLSPDVAGEITELYVEEGDSVVQGQLLVRIRPDNFISALDRAQATSNQQMANLESTKANLARAEATFMRLELDFERQSTLFKEKVISEADFQMAEQNYKIAKNDLEAAKQAVKAADFQVRSSLATVKEARENVRLTNVTAPVSGIVSKLSVDKGERVVGTQQMAGTEMMRIADLNKMEVRVNVNENDIIRLSLGDTAIIDVDAYSYLNKKFKGVVTSIANTAKDKASSDAITEFEVRIRILNSSYQDLVDEGRKFPFRPGMTASVDIITKRKDNVLSIPLAAVTTRNPAAMASDMPGGRPAASSPAKQGKKEDEKEVVFVKMGNVVKMVEVKTGISDYENIEILEGVTDTTQVVTGPYLVVSKRLKDGEKIRTKETPKKEETKKIKEEEKE
jgi:HlyD family secretion protein